MAEAKSTLQCSICLETFTEPKVLPCCHTFCKGCLSKLPVTKKQRDEPHKDEKFSEDIGNEACASHVKDDGEDTDAESDMEADVDEVEEGKVGEGSSSDCEWELSSGHSFSEESPSVSSDSCSASHEEELILCDRRDDLSPSWLAGYQQYLREEGLDDGIPGTVVDPPVDGEYLTCPQCRVEHRIVGSKGVECFLTDFVADSQARLKHGSPSETHVRDLSCDWCDKSDPVVASCKDCSEFLCDFCRQAHTRIKRFEGHVITTFSDSEAVVDCDLSSFKESGIRYHCTCHPEEIIQLYCKECNTVVCKKCIVLPDHFLHRFVEIDISLKQGVDKQLTSLLAAVDKLMNKQQENLEYVKKIEKKTSNVGDDRNKDISSTFDSYIAAVEKRRNELLKESENDCNSRMKTLWSERDRLERIVADMTATLQFTKRIKDCEDFKKFLLLSSQALPRLKKLRTWEWSRRATEEVDETHVLFDKSDLDVDFPSKACRLCCEDDL